MQHKGTVRLETNRLILRPFKLEDAETVFKNWASDDEVTKFLTWQTHATVEDSKEFMEFCVNGYQEKDCYQWGMELKDTQELIGNISVVKVNEEIDGVELGWVIGRSFWGKGYTAEAAKEVIRFLIEEVGANRVAARYDTNNPNSGRVMEKAGMKYEGTLRQGDRNNQGIVDCVYYSIAASILASSPLSKMPKPQMPPHSLGSPLSEKYITQGGWKMNKKVTLKELVGTKIVYALIVTVYYWMWARNDWKSYYDTIQTALAIFLVTFFVLQANRIKKYKKEGIDEMAEQNLKRCDSICYKILIAAMVITAWICAIIGHTGVISSEFIGWIIILTILALTVIRTIIFSIMDVRGI